MWHQEIYDCVPIKANVVNNIESCKNLNACEKYPASQYILFALAVQLLRNSFLSSSKSAMNSTGGLGPPAASTRSEILFVISK